MGGFNIYVKEVHATNIIVNHTQSTHVSDDISSSEARDEAIPNTVEDEVSNYPNNPVENEEGSHRACEEDEEVETFKEEEEQSEAWGEGEKCMGTINSRWQQLQLEVSEPRAQALNEVLDDISDEVQLMDNRILEENNFSTLTPLDLSVDLNATTWPTIGQPGTRENNGLVIVPVAYGNAEGPKEKEKGKKRKLNKMGKKNKKCSENKTSKTKNRNNPPSNFSCSEDISDPDSENEAKETWQLGKKVGLSAPDETAVTKALRIAAKKVKERKGKKDGI